MSALLTAAYDRGPSPYFHGREGIRREFKKLLGRAHASKTGTTFLIQGAPGVGKTALLFELDKIASRIRWEVVYINLQDLCDPAHLAQTFGESYVTRKQTATNLDAKVVSREYVKEVLGDSSVIQVLKKLVPDHGMVLVLDEAQRIAAFAGKPEELKVMELLDVIHNGKLGKPAILLAAGLGPTKASFGKLGISRFSEDCVVELSALSKEFERLVIEDWIKKEGRGQGDPSAWMDAIAQETHGWPRHVHSYAKHASEYLQANGGVMAPDGLSSVLEAGHEARKVYYKQRVDDFKPSEIQCLARSIADVQPGIPMDDMDIVSSMAQKFGDDQAEEVFKRFEEKGILGKTTMGYTVPIPSMHIWLKETYTREKIELPRETQKSRVERSRGSGLER